MCRRNQYSSLAPDELLPPSPKGHRVIEFEETPVMPAEERRTPSPVAIGVPSSLQEEQGSVHEVSLTSLIFDHSADHRLLCISWRISLHMSMNSGYKNPQSLPVSMKNCPARRLRVGAFVSKYVKLHSNHVDVDSYVFSDRQRRHISSGIYRADR